MSEPSISLQSLLEKSQDYLETKVELVKLKTIDKSSDVLSTVVVLVTAILVGILAFLFISIGLALYIGSLLDSISAGFFILGGFYGIILLLVCLLRNKWIKIPVANLIIKLMLK